MGRAGFWSGKELAVATAAPGTAVAFICEFTGGVMDMTGKLGLTMLSVETGRTNSVAVVSLC